MTKEEFYDKYDFGFSVKESFEEYISRVGEAINLYRLSFGEPSQGLKDKIIEIFECATVPNENNTKFKDVYNLLKHNLKREPTTGDLQGLVNRLKAQLDKPVQKQLYNIGVDPIKEEDKSTRKLEINSRLNNELIRTKLENKI